MTGIGNDGRGIVMRDEDLRQGMRQAAERSPRKLETRLTPGEKPGRRRTAQVATVDPIASFVRSASDLVHPPHDRTEVEAKRPRPMDKRVWASVEKSGQLDLAQDHERSRASRYADAKVPEPRPPPKAHLRRVQ